MNAVLRRAGPKVIIQVLAWTTLLAILAATISPIHQRPHLLSEPTPERAGAYFLLGFLFCVGYRRHWPATLILVLVAAGSFEAAQLLLGDRHAEIAAAMVKGVGGVVGTGFGLPDNGETVSVDGVGGRVQGARSLLLPPSLPNRWTAIRPSRGSSELNCSRSMSLRRMDQSPTERRRACRERVNSADKNERQWFACQKETAVPAVDIDTVTDRELRTKAKWAGRAFPGSGDDLHDDEVFRRLDEDMLAMPTDQRIVPPTLWQRLKARLLTAL